jgi:DNA-binding XRE family transcriptional regulator
MRLASDSGRIPAARRFGAELRVALAARGMTQRGFARTNDVGRSRLANWVTGSSVPSVETAERIADALMWPKLADLARAAYRINCGGCGQEFTALTNGPARYCSEACRRYHTKLAGASRDLSRAVLERQAARYATAIAAMCAACEPSGLCRTADCPLQVAGVSPLAVARLA